MTWLKQALTPMAITALVLGAIVLFWGSELRKLVSTSWFGKTAQTQPIHVKRSLLEIQQNFMKADADLDGRLGRLFKLPVRPLQPAQLRLTESAERRPSMLKAKSRIQPDKSPASRRRNQEAPANRT